MIKRIISEPSPVDLKIKIGESVFVLIILIIFSSCIMDSKRSFFIKNCTSDTLFIEFTESDTLVNWNFDPCDDFETALNKATIGNCIYPDSIIKVDPNVFFYNDTCYIYITKWLIATNYQPKEILAQELYKRIPVTVKDFKHNRLFKIER